MKEEKCIECNVICNECKNYLKAINETGEYDRCKVFPIRKMSCINGTSNCDYDLCINHNENGNCKLYSEDKNQIIKHKLIQALKEYRNNLSPYSTYNNNPLDEITSHLLSGLQGEPMRNLCWFTEDERISKYKCQKYKKSYLL